mgnify:FL=1
MNTLDIILLICFVPAVIRGLSKGFLEQAISLAGVIASVWASFRFSNIVSPWIKPYIEVSDTLLSVISFAAVLVVGLILTVLIAKGLTKVIEMAMLGWLNKVLGLLLGIVVTLLVLGTIIVLFDTLNLKYGLVPEAKLAESIMYNSIKDLAYTVFPYMKELLMKQ